MRVGRDFDLKPILEPFAPLKKYMTVVSGLGNKPAESSAVHAIVPATWLSCRAPAAEPRAVRRRHDRPDRRAPHRPGNAAALARGRDRGGRRRRRVRRHLRLQLRPHDLVPHADDAAADGVRAAQGVREDLRPRQERRRAARGFRRLPEPARHGARRSERVEGHARRRGPRARRRLSRQRARDRAAARALGPARSHEDRPARRAGRAAELRRSACACSSTSSSRRSRPT